LNVSASEDWTKFYDLESFNLIKNSFKEDIECFGYDNNPHCYGIRY